MAQRMAFETDTQATDYLVQLGYDSGILFNLIEMRNNPPPFDWQSTREDDKTPASSRVCVQHIDTVTSDARPWSAHGKGTVSQAGPGKRGSGGAMDFIRTVNPPQGGPSTRSI